MKAQNESSRYELAAVHAEVDREAAAIAARLGERITCQRGCAGCCVDGLTVFEIEADRIRRDVGDRLAGSTAHTAGACAFLDTDGACRIYESRPYVCRSQGLPLRWLEENDDGETVEYRDICPLNDHGTPIETLGEDDCWTIGPIEARLVHLQRAARGDAGQRIALRELFVELSERSTES